MDQPSRRTGGKGLRTQQDAGANPASWSASALDPSCTRASYCVVVVVLVLGMLDVGELLRSVLPLVDPEGLLPAVPDAPIEVPLPRSVLGAGVLPAVVEPVVLPAGAAGVLMEPLAVLEVSLGEVVVDGIVLELELVDDEVSGADASFLPQAVSDSAAIRAKAAHCAIGDLIIRNSLRVSSMHYRERRTAFRGCLRLPLVVTLHRRVVWHCRRL